MDDAEGSDAAIEAIIEDEELKRDSSSGWTRCCRPRSSWPRPSSVPIKLGAETSQPHQVIGLHFFNPVPVLPLVEIVHLS